MFRAAVHLYMTSYNACLLCVILTTDENDWHFGDMAVMLAMWGRLRKIPKYYNKPETYDIRQEPYAVDAAFAYEERCNAWKEYESGVILGVCVVYAEILCSVILGICVAWLILKVPLY